MAIKSHWIMHKNKRIYFVDYSGFGHDFELLKKEIKESTIVICAQPEKFVLTLVDVSNTVATSQALDYLKECLKSSNKHMKKIAVLGVEGLKNILMKAIIRIFNLNIKSFEHTEKAKDWLIESDETDDKSG
ncbi:MAG: hypothetical protein ABIG64_02130 [Candidatus Omnitrophota bacterium]